MIRRPLVVVVVGPVAPAALLPAACGSSGSSTTNVNASTTTTSPTQTTKAADREPNSKLSKVQITTMQGDLEATNLLKASKGTWSVVDRAKYCVQGQIPADVYTPGYTTN